MYGLGHKIACTFSSVLIIENPPLFSLILELCHPLKFAGWHPSVVLFSML